MLFRSDPSRSSLETSSVESTYAPPEEGQSNSQQRPAADGGRRSISSIEFATGSSSLGVDDDGSSSHLPRQMSETSSDPTHAQNTTSSTITATIASTFTNAMRYIMTPSEPNRPSSPSPSLYRQPLVLDSGAIDERPHIKYDWTIGKRLKFSCTVYFAKEFEALRKRCGVEDVMAKSLERSEIWAAKGGKSRSNFWKTTDDRFIVKTLVNAWNVADL